MPGEVPRLHLNLFVCVCVVFYHKAVCLFRQVCEQPGEDLQACEGQCCGMFHLSCLGVGVKPEDKMLCQECTTGESVYTAG